MFDLPWRDMYEAWAVVGSYLTATAKGGETKDQKALRQRAEAPDDLAAAARELDTAQGSWPKVDDYQASPRNSAVTPASISSRAGNAGRTPGKRSSVTASPRHRRSAPSAEQPAAGVEATRTVSPGSATG